MHLAMVVSVVPDNDELLAKDSVWLDFDELKHLALPGRICSENQLSNNRFQQTIRSAARR